MQSGRVSVLHLFSVIVILVASACSSATPSTPPGSSPTVVLPPCEWVDVVRVIDGDTIVAEVGGQQERVRYIGMDTPEVSPAEAFGPEATERNRELLEDGEVCLERDISERDRYDRLLRYAWLRDGRMVNEVLLAEGLAVVATFPPDVKYAERRFLPAQRKAREEGLGLWVE